MEITRVQVTKSENGKLKGFANITINDCFVVTGLRIIEGINGLFVAMPSQRMQDGTFKDIAFPINQETRDLITKAVLDKFNITE